MGRATRHRLSVAHCYRDSKELRKLTFERDPQQRRLLRSVSNKKLDAMERVKLWHDEKEGGWAQERDREWSSESGCAAMGRGRARHATARKKHGVS